MCKAHPPSTQSQACTLAPINSDKFSDKFRDKPSSIISQCLKVHVPTQLLKDPSFPPPHPIHSNLYCSLGSPVTPLAISVPFSNQSLPQSQRPPPPPQEAMEEEEGCFPLCTEPDTGWPFVPRLCCLHGFLALTMQVLLQYGPKSKAED